LLWPSLPAIPDLRRLGVRRLSVGASLTRAAYETMRRAATELLKDGSYAALSSGTLTARELNQLMTQASAHD
jgi:2-methylisocitrate lyase-like PEP mutase family enzyme